MLQTRPSLHVLSTVAATLALMVIAGAASPTGAPNDGRWPNGEVRVYDGSGWNHAVPLGMRQWNAAELGVRFVPVDRREDADVVIVEDDERVRARCDNRCAAYTTRIGFRQGAVPTEILLPVRMLSETGQPSIKDVQLVVHELGHVLGLRHRNLHCKVMNPDLARDCKPMLGDAGWLCGPLDLDLRKAASLYHVRPAWVDPYCLV
jgi:hypothetical protein